MLQSPSSDGPPSLGELDAARRATNSMRGPAVVLGTARVAIAEDDDGVALNDEAALIENTAYGCVTKALSELPQTSTPKLIHVTFTPDLDPHAVGRGVLRAGGEVNIDVLGRSVAKKGGTPRTVEVLILADGLRILTGYSTTSSPSPSTENNSSMQEAIQNAKASEQNVDESEVIFGLFVTSHDEDAARQLLGSRLPMYGGRASQVEWEDGEKQNGALIAGGQVIVDSGGSNSSAVALVSGSTSFLISAVIKSWAQPAFVDALDFLKPRYTGDAGDDLLQAIKFDDRPMFEKCLKEVGPNFQWVTKQHQTPLLAAAGRGRTHMVQRIVDEGGDVKYRNDGGFNAVMYTLRLSDYGEEFVKTQLDVLEGAGADLNDTDVILP